MCPTVTPANTELIESVLVLDALGTVERDTMHGTENSEGKYGTESDLCVLYSDSSLHGRVV